MQFEKRAIDFFLLGPSPTCVIFCTIHAPSKDERAEINKKKYAFVQTKIKLLGSIILGKFKRETMSIKYASFTPKMLFCCTVL